MTTYDDDERKPADTPDAGFDDPEAGPADDTADDDKAGDDEDSEDSEDEDGGKPDTAYLPGAEEN